MAAPTTTIRVAAPYDFEVIARLWNVLHDQHVDLVPDHFQRLPEPWLLDSIERNCGSPWTDFLMAEVDEVVRGFVLVGIEDPTHPGVRPTRRGIIYELVVDPDFRSQGIGRLLADHASEWARQRGAEEMSLYVFEANQRAVDFYLNSGWHVEMRRMVRKI